jgi:hypothetical protein
MELAGLEPATSWVRCKRGLDYPARTGIVARYSPTKESGDGRESPGVTRHTLTTFCGLFGVDQPNDEDIVPPAEDDALAAAVGHEGRIKADADPGPLPCGR